VHRLKAALGDGCRRSSPTRCDDPPQRDGDLRSHERCLDLRSGLLERYAEWSSAAHRAVRVSSQRLVSLTQRAILAIRYEVEAVDQPVRVVLRSELVANEPLPSVGHDPRVAAALESALEPEEHNAADHRAHPAARARGEGPALPGARALSSSSWIRG
jgi:alpha,alpha-trehalose phosphorylase